MPAFVSAAVFLLCWLLTLEVFAFFADFAFHQTTVNSKVWVSPTATQVHAEARSKSLVATPPFDWTVDPISITPSENDTANALATTLDGKTSSMLLGRRVNETYCASWTHKFGDSILPTAKDSCGYMDSAISGNAIVWAPKGQTAFANSSTTHAVAWTDDTHSIMVAPVQPNFSYTAIAPGIKATCFPITRECTNCGLSGSLDFETCGSAASITLQCNGLHAYNGTAKRVGWLDDKGNSGVGYRPVSNPLEWGTTIRSQAYGNGRSQGEYDNSTGFLFWGNSGATNVLHCDVAVRLVTYRFDPPSSFKTLDTYDVDGEAASRFTWSTDGIGAGTFDLIGELINGAGLLASDPYPEVYARTFSRYVMAYAAEMMCSTPVTTLEGQGVPGTRIHLVVLALFTSIIAIECLTISFVALAAAAHAWKTNDVSIRAVRKRLSGPFPLLCQTFGTPRRLQPRLGEVQKQAFLTEDNLKLFECEEASGAHGLRLRKAPYVAASGSPLADNAATWNLIAD